MGRRTSRISEGKRGSLTYTKPTAVVQALGKWSVSHAHGEIDLNERKRTLLSNVPILSMVVATGIPVQDIMDALQPLRYAGNDYILRQGGNDTDLFFVESGTVHITRLKLKKSTKEEQQVSSRCEYEYFGEYAFAFSQNSSRTANAVAIGEAHCFSMSLENCNKLLFSVKELMRFRSLMRENGVLDNLNVFSALTPAQRGRMLGLSTLKAYADGAFICKHGEMDDQYFVIVEGQAKICVKSNGIDVELVRKEPFQGFGEMGLFGKPRTADVIAVGPIQCIIMNRESFVKAQMANGSSIDTEAHKIISNTVSSEFEMIKRIETMHSNPKVVGCILRLVRKFKHIQAQKFAGKTMYSDFYRRVFNNPKLALDFASISNRIDWFDATSSLKFIRYEAKRILSTEPNKEKDRTPDQLAFIGRLCEMTSLLEKFSVDSTTPSRTNDNRFYMAVQLARLMEFVVVKKGKYIFKQNAIEGKAYMVLSGSVNVVYEDNSTIADPLNSHIVATLTGGDSFGELTLVTNMPRSASAIAATDTELILIQRRHFAKFLAARPGFKIRHYIIERADFLMQIGSFAISDQKSCIRVAYDMIEIQYCAQHIFTKQGQHANAFYVIKEGQVGVYRTADNIGFGLVLVASLGPQQGFGMSAFQANELEDTTFMAITTVIVLELADTRARRMDLHIIEATRRELRQRREWEQSVSTRAKTALVYKENAPWTLMGDDKPGLFHQVAALEDARNTSCTRIIRAMTDSEVLPPERRVRQVDERWKGPTFSLPTKEKWSKLLLGSFLTKKLQSFQMLNAVMPMGPSNTITIPQLPKENPPASLLPPLDKPQSSGPTMEKTPTVETPEDSVDIVEWAVEDCVDDDCSNMWKFERVHEHNLYL
ncbi:kinase [Thraustotheca clavata]|uniref:Kinase n=1 Tax=Thraustotheca clavata TaxID=74557 RepID=A0A1V9ZS24_9STRA|nr:kinase [Thraustotheca clavata]